MPPHPRSVCHPLTERTGGRLNDLIDLSKLQSVAENLAHVINMRLHDPLFWLQFAVIASVFVFARWLLTPLHRWRLALQGADHRQGELRATEPAGRDLRDEL